MESIDIALRNLHLRVGSTKLLRTANSKDLFFERAGNQLTQLPNGEMFGGWNGGNGRIAFSNPGMANAREAQDTVYHEIAHNWDEPSENAYINQFRLINGWRIGWVGGFTASDAVGDNWFYKTAGSSFIRTYGRNNPQEDYATAWEAYFDLKYHGNLKNLPNLAVQKIANLDSLFATLG